MNAVASHFGSPLACSCHHHSSTITIEKVLYSRISNFDIWKRGQVDCMAPGRPLQIAASKEEKKQTTNTFTCIVFLINENVGVRDFLSSMNIFVWLLWSWLQDFRNALSYSIHMLKSVVTYVRYFGLVHNDRTANTTSGKSRSA